MRKLLVLTMLLVWMVPAQAAVRSQTVEYKQGDALLEGYLVYDDALKGKRPAVLIVHEWWGLNDFIKGRADQLAQMGYIVFAADIYGKGKRAKDATEAGKLAGIYWSDRKLLRARANAGPTALQAAIEALSALFLLSPRFLGLSGPV